MEDQGNDKRNAPDDIQEVLGLGGTNGGQSRFDMQWIWAGLAFSTIAVFVLLLRGSPDGDRSAFLTEKISRGDLLVTVTATGTVEPRNEVSVGIEVSGTIAEVFVDYNDTVEAGALLARLDTTILSAQAAQSRASLDLSRASKLEAAATLRQTERDFARLKKLREVSDGALPSLQDLEAAEVALARAEASVANAEAQIQQAEAQLSVKQTELANAAVVSPIRGVVLSRQVDPGQTVAATFQTPELFVIAEDLREVELRIEVDEADVGQVREGQAARFTVDAYPDEEFPAEITQVRYAPISSAGVVTYEAILSVDNSDLRLLPGMTATAVVDVRQIANALLVPNEAMRFSPRLADKKKSGRGGITSMLIPRPPSSGGVADRVETRTRQRLVWVLDGNDEPRPVEIRIGMSDGVLTEVVSGALEEGSSIIVQQEGAK